MRFALHAGCKVNLYLDIVGVRADGYHLLESLFYPLATPADTLIVTERKEPGLVLTCSQENLATVDNLIAKAYRGYQERTGWAPGVAVHLEKRIPLGAGIGGGSSDAAVFLRWLNGTAGERALSAPDLQALAARLGADVPFFLQDGPAWVCGVGEVLEPVEVRLPGSFMVLVCPPVHVSTAWAYQRWDDLRRESRPRKELTCPKCMVMSRSSARQLGFMNSFEEVVFPEFPVLSDIKDELLQRGALAAVMSGSGASIVGIFPTRADAENVMLDLRCRGNECFGAHLGRARAQV